MPRMGVACYLTTLLLVVPASAIAKDESSQAAAERKARTLEEHASAGDDPGPQGPTITKAEAQAVDPSGERPLDDPLTCLARTLYWEAKGESDAGMRAVANVVLNRLGHEGFPDTVCGVVKQGQETGACQFSWWCDGRSDDTEEPEPYAQAKEIARRALNGQLEDATDGALYFHHSRLDPPWAGEYIKTTRVGDHLFYKPTYGDAR